MVAETVGIGDRVILSERGKLNVSDVDSDCVSTSVAVGDCA